ncbi:MAG: phosphonate ABC transporter ATP-binding protein [Deltaproteobacteria bacterium]|nr:phosphonate ABC transporter ATP-binding protein [Deltaproteobacteria bacterium]
MATYAYEIEGLRKVFPDGTIAVDDLSLCVEAGEQVAIIGPSGAGKTTLFRLLNGTLRPTSGILRINGRDVLALSRRELRALRRTIGTVYQQHNLVGRLRVVHNVLAGNLGRWSLPRALTSLLLPRDVGRALESLDHVGIAEKLYARTDELSGGQQQRVAIARVLVQDPAIILADEPVSSVDPSLAVGLVRLLRQIAEGGKTLLVNLHTVDLALDHFPRVVGFREGRIAFDLPARDVTHEMLVGLYKGSTVMGQEDGGPADHESFRRLQAFRGMD